MSAKGQKQTSDQQRSLGKHSRARQNDLDFGELTRLRIDLDRSRMLLDVDGEPRAVVEVRYRGQAGG